MLIVQFMLIMMLMLLLWEKNIKGAGEGADDVVAITLGTGLVEV